MTCRTFATVAIKAQGPPSRAPGTYGMNADVVVMPDGREIKAGGGGGTLDIP